eukprot:268476_1
MPPTVTTLLPTQTPTVTPSLPTQTPSLPTVTPSLPTHIPSSSPIEAIHSSTNEPACLYFNSSLEYRHMDTEVMIEDYAAYYQISTSNPYIIYAYDENEDNKLNLQPVTCVNNDNEHVEECFIQCLSKEACIKSTIRPQKRLELLSIVCDDIKSCKQSNLFINNIN